VEKEFGRLDVLINNAGLVPKEETLISRLRETFEANTFGPAVVTETFTPLLRKSENARLIFVTSSLGSISEKLDPANWSSPLPVLEYRMSKTALNMLAAYHHVHFEGKVKVWTYCPGYVVTDLSRTGQQGIEERKNRGAGDPRDSAAGILALVEGKRDSEVGSFVNKDGKIEW
jgi:NAD(P)-dependent dehydrogenase (short-subunit alcohol dehydrogenase family)